jgi:hypothetical protein
MENSKLIIGNLFMAAWFVAVFSWFLGIVESILTRLMKDIIFRKGIKLVDFTEKGSCFSDNVIVNKLFETDNAKFKFINNQRCVFREKTSWFSFKWHTPFPLKGSVTFKNEIAHVEGRLPLGATIFFSAWLMAWTVGSIGAGIQGGNLIVSIFMLLLGWGVAAAMYFPSAAREKKRLLVLYDEIKRQLNY